MTIKQHSALTAKDKSCAENGIRVDDASECAESAPEARESVLWPTVFHTIMREAAVRAASPLHALQTAMLHERLWYEFQNDTVLCRAAEQHVQERLLHLAIDEHHHAGYAWNTPVHLQGRGALKVFRLPAQTLLRSITLLPSDESDSDCAAPVQIQAKLLRLPIACSRASMTLAGHVLCSALERRCECVLLAASLNESLLVLQNMDPVHEKISLLLAFERLQTQEEIEEHCVL